MTDITIPREALEAAMREYNRARDNDSENPLHNACLAMLRNWPGAWTQTVMGKPMCYSLPLTENTNAE